MTTLMVESHESFEHILRRFTKQCERSWPPSELRKRQHYEQARVKRTARAARKKAEKRHCMSD